MVHCSRQKTWANSVSTQPFLILMLLSSIPMSVSTMASFTSNLMISTRFSSHWKWSRTRCEWVTILSTRQEWNCRIWVSTLTRWMLSFWITIKITNGTSSVNLCRSVGRKRGGHNAQNDSAATNSTGRGMTPFSPRNTLDFSGVIWTSRRGTRSHRLGRCCTDWPCTSRKNCVSISNVKRKSSSMWANTHAFLNLCRRILAKVTRTSIMSHRARQPGSSYGYWQSNHHSFPTWISVVSHATWIV